MIHSADQIREVLDFMYRAESRRVLATLIRLLGDFDRAEEALPDAFAAAMEQWPQNGVPTNPRAWLVSADDSKPSTPCGGGLGSMPRWWSLRVGWRGRVT
jgi:hypothetical protein